MMWRARRHAHRLARLGEPAHVRLRLHLCLHLRGGEEQRACERAAASAPALPPRPPRTPRHERARQRAPPPRAVRGREPRRSREASADARMHASEPAAQRRHLRVRRARRVPMRAPRGAREAPAASYHRGLRHVGRGARTPRGRRGAGARARRPREARGRATRRATTSSTCFARSSSGASA